MSKGPKRFIRVYTYFCKACGGFAFLYREGLGFRKASVES